MDATTIQCGKDTRDLIRDYRDKHGFDNYNQALKDMNKRAVVNRSVDEDE